MSINVKKKEKKIAKQSKATSKIVHNTGGAYCNAFQSNKTVLFLQWTDVKKKPKPRKRETDLW